MKLKILLINPWVYDYAAANLWSRPLGLLKVSEYLSEFTVKLAFIDCMDVYEPKRYGMGFYPKEMVEKPASLKEIPRTFRRYGMPVDEFKGKVLSHHPFDIVFITSIMSYWYPGIQEAIALVRSISKNVPVILGGIYATLWGDHAADMSGADFIYTGHISDNLKFALQIFGFRLKEKENGTNVHEPVIPPPSPPLAKGGWEDLNGKKGGIIGFRKRYSDNKIPYYKLGLYGDYPFAPVLTSIGCPYNCPYCSTRLLHDTFQQRDTDAVFEEIRELCNRGVQDFAFYDDALLVNPDSHIKPLLNKIMKNSLGTRLHSPNGLHARFIDDELAYLMKKSGFRTIRLSLETVNEDRQKQNGGKVTSQDLSTAVSNLKKQGFIKNDIGVYMMYGLPGQGLEEVMTGVQFLKDLDVRINLTEFSPIPGTANWNELLAKGIITDDIDPLLTNNSVFSYLFSGYNHDALKKLKDDVNQYNAKPPVS